MSNNCLGKQAIVIGGSISGLLAARVLSDYFEQVTVIERDRYPEKPSPRKGIPQSFHAHQLMLKGLEIFENLFPGLENNLVDAGAQKFDMGSEMAWLTPAGWGVSFDSGLDMLAFSRDILDWFIHQKLSALNNVTFLESSEVVGLLSNLDKTAVTGVKIRVGTKLANNDAKAKLLEADLVVDASGRASKTPRWLENLGYIPPQETVVDALPGYATCIYQIPLAIQAKWKSRYVQAAPPTRMRAGIIFPIEGDRCIVTLVSFGSDNLPRNEVEFLDFARSLESPIIYNAIINAQPLSSIFAYRAQGNRLRHYERLSKYINSFVVLGDAVCTFNPVYGQGMTVAALEAITLQKCLQKQCQNDTLLNLSKVFQQKLAKVNQSAWALSTSQDYRYPCVKGKPPGYEVKLFNWYIDKIVKLTTYDSEVRLRFFEVMHMLKAPSVLFKPSIILKVLRQMIDIRYSTLQLKNVQL
jgi:2-polyprenyl-6-methoxyphenol hydroxylase-like FAD-dependent oxidoreductase